MSWGVIPTSLQWLMMNRQLGMSSGEVMDTQQRDGAGDDLKVSQGTHQLSLFNPMLQQVLTRKRRKRPFECAKSPFVSNFKFWSSAYAQKDHLRVEEKMQLVACNGNGTSLKLQVGFLRAKSHQNYDPVRSWVKADPAISSDLRRKCVEGHSRKTLDKYKINIV